MRPILGVAQRLCPSSLRALQAPLVDPPKSPAMLSLPSTGSRHRWNCIRVHQAAADYMVSGGLFDDSRQKGVYAMKLYRHLGISYNAAWRMKHKFVQVMMVRVQAAQLSRIIELDDVYSGGQRTGGKRGRGTAGKITFVAVIDINSEHHPKRIKFSVVKGFRSKEIELCAAAAEHP